jgi:hypothetical protein
LIKIISTGNSDFEKQIEEECKKLSKIGSEIFQIRHFEQDRAEIKDNKHIDYLYYRMISLIHLFLSELEKNTNNINVLRNNHQNVLYSKRA